MGAITAVCDNNQGANRLLFFLLWALFRTVAQDLRVLRFPFAYRGIKEETDVRTTMENPVQTKIKRKEEKKMCLGMT